MGIEPTANEIELIQTRSKTRAGVIDFDHNKIDLHAKPIESIWSFVESITVSIESILSAGKSLFVRSDSLSGAGKSFLLRSHSLLRLRHSLRPPRHSLFAFGRSILS